MLFGPPSACRVDGPGSVADALAEPFELRHARAAVGAAFGAGLQAVEGFACPEGGEDVVLGHVEAVADLVRDRANTLGQDREEAARNREFSREAARGFEHANRAYHELGAAGERVAERTETLVQERKAHEWELERAARRERDRDWGHEL